ncbi:MAG: hypothetical protein Salg2KO_19760 [Salibacteraceae bacterium]
MKKLTLIVSVFAMVAFSSCEKDEFEDIVVKQEVNPIEAKITSTSSTTESTGIEIIGKADEVVEEADPNDEIIISDDIEIISIKEVSDGDDEADSGDESRKGE